MSLNLLEAIYLKVRFGIISAEAIRYRFIRVKLRLECDQSDEIIIQSE